VSAPATLNISWDDIRLLPKDMADHIIAYGEAPEQFGELRLPKSSGPHPVVVFIHGGCWLNKYGVDHIAAASRALADEGYAVWSPEYRRVGDTGGGWPGTFEDLSKSIRILAELAGGYSLRLDHVIVVGHSAGGHLALWLAAQTTNPLPLRGVISLAGITDLRAYEALANDCASSLPDLLGGTSLEQADRWAKVDPVRLLPLAIPSIFIHGELDDIVPLAQSEHMGGTLHVVKGGGHFDMLSPYSEAFKIMCQALKDI
jgi:acetyl esterase/lipase